MSSEDIATPKEALSSNTFLWDSSLFLVLSERRQFKQKKTSTSFDVILLNNADSFFFTTR